MKLIGNMSSLKSSSPTSMLEEMSNFQGLPETVTKLFIPSNLKGMTLESLNDKIKTSTSGKLSMQDHGCLSSFNRANNSLRGVTKQWCGKKLLYNLSASYKYYSLMDTSVIAFSSLETGKIANKLNIKKVTQTILSLQLKWRSDSYPAGLDKCAGRKLIEYHSSIAHEHLRKCAGIIVPLPKMPGPKTLQSSLISPKLSSKSAQNLDNKSSKEQKQTQDHALPPLPPTIEVPPPHERSESMRCSLNNIAQANKKKANSYLCLSSVDSETQCSIMGTQHTDTPRQYPPARDHATVTRASEHETSAFKSTVQQAVINTPQAQNQMPDSQQQEDRQAMVDTPEVQDQMPDSQQREIEQAMVDTPEAPRSHQQEFSIREDADAQNCNPVAEQQTLASPVQDQTSGSVPFGTATTQRYVTATGQSCTTIPVQIHPSALQQQTAGSLPIHVQVPVSQQTAGGQSCTPISVQIHPSALEQLIAGHSGQTYVPAARQSCTPVPVQIHPSALQQLIAGQASAPALMQIHPSALQQLTAGQASAPISVQIHPSALQHAVAGQSCASVPVQIHPSALQQLVAGQASGSGYQQPVGRQTSVPISVQTHPSALQQLAGQASGSGYQQPVGRQTSVPISVQTHPSGLQQPVTEQSVQTHVAQTGQSYMPIPVQIQQPVAQQAFVSHPVNSSTADQQENVSCMSPISQPHRHIMSSFISPQSQLVSLTYLNNVPQCAVHPTHPHPNHVHNPQVTDTRCAPNNSSGHCCHHANAEALLAQTSHQSILIAQQPVSLLPSVARMQFLSPFTVYPVNLPQISNAVPNHGCQQNSANFIVMQMSEEKQCQTDGTGNRTSTRLQEMNACSVPLKRLSNVDAEVKDATAQKCKKRKGKGCGSKKSRQY